MSRRPLTECALALGISLSALLILWYVDMFNIHGPLMSACFAMLASLTILASVAIAKIAVQSYYDYRDDKRPISALRTNRVRLGTHHYQLDFMKRETVSKVLSCYLGERWIEEEWLLCGDHWLIEQETTGTKFIYILTVNPTDGTNIVVEFRVFMNTLSSAHTLLAYTSSCKYLGVIRGNSKTPGIFTQEERKRYQSAPHDTSPLDPLVLHRLASLNTLLDLASRLDYNALSQAWSVEEQ